MTKFKSMLDLVTRSRKRKQVGLGLANMKGHIKYLCHFSEAKSGTESQVKTHT